MSRQYSREEWAAYRAKNRDKLNEQNRAYVARNRDKSREATRASRLRNLEASLVSGARKRARASGIECTITAEDIQIPDVCPYLGIPIIRGARRATANSPSIDRINPKLGYVPGNVIVVSYSANAMKRDATPWTLVQFGERMRELIETDPRFQEAA